MRTAGLPSPTATLEDRFRIRFSYCLLNNNAFYIISTSKKHIHTLPFLQQAAHNSSSRTTRPVLKCTRESKALLRDLPCYLVDKHKNGWGGCGYQLWKPNVASGRTVWTSSCGWMAGIIPTVTCGGAVDAIQVRRTCAVTATREIELWGTLIWVLRQVKNKLEIALYPHLSPWKPGRQMQLPVTWSQWPWWQVLHRKAQASPYLPSVQGMSHLQRRRSPN